MGSRLINSDEVQAVVRPQKKNVRQPQRRNPLVNLGAMLKLNPHAKADLRAADSRKRKAPSLAPGSTAVKKQVSRRDLLKPQEASSNSFLASYNKAAGV